MTKAERHPHAAAMKGTVAGARIGPTLAPELNSAVAKARSLFGNHCAVALMADGKLPDYAYNTQRDLFDAAILKAAERAGAKIFRKAAKLEKGSEPGTVRLSDETLEAAGGFFGKKPDLIVDASGRVRAIARLLELPERRGGRNDVALFAHLDKSFMTDPGNIHVDYLTKGWSWRIPLPSPPGQRRTPSSPRWRSPRGRATDWPRICARARSDRGSAHRFQTPDPGDAHSGWPRRRGPP